MSDAEVALELLKLVLEKEQTEFATAKSHREFLFSLYRECLAAVRKPATEA
jgi:hypothetical protein